MKKIQLIILMLLVCSISGYAQTISVTGKVTSIDDNLPVIGATVILKGTNNAVVTDSEGNYRISLKGELPKTLTFAFLGLKTKEVAINSGGVHNVALELDAMMLDELVVTGYGNYTKRDYTGAASTISVDRTKDVPSVSVQSRLEGVIPGLQITSNSGQPGANETVRIRGMGSINAGNEPLYVIDGIPTVAGNADYANISSAGNSILSTINPNDIDNITVIKDAAAASLYGSRAANGVIIITTKQGKAGKTQFSAKASYGITKMATDWRPTLDGDATVDIFKLGLKNYAIYSAEMSEKDAIEFADSNIGSFYTKPWSGWTNWRDYLIRTGKAQQYEVSASGGNEKTRFFSSLSYSDIKGITYQSDYKRVTGRLNVNHTSGRFSLDGGIMYSNTSQSVDTEGEEVSSPIMGIGFALSPADYPYNEDGTINTNKGFSLYGSPLANPMQTKEYNYNKTTLNRAMANVKAKLDIIDGLSFREVLSYDYKNTNGEIWWDPRTINGLASRGELQKYSISDGTLVSQTQLVYSKTFAEKHNLSALASFEIERFDIGYMQATGSNYSTNLLPEINNAGSSKGKSHKEASSLMSGVFDANYNYDSRLFFKASYRRDGSSRLSKDNRWGNFWAVSASWRMSEEKWFAQGGVSEVIDDLKIRASYGVNGTQPNGFYNYMGLYGYGYNYNGNPGSAESQIPNPLLSWESNKSTNIGLDITLLRRLSLSIDAYQRTTEGLILDKPISNTTGFGSISSNVGSLRNRGIEIDIRYNAISNNDWTWNVGLNMSHNRNTVLSLADGQNEIYKDRWVHRVGQPYYSFNLYEYAGVDPATGMEQYYTNTLDKNGNIIDHTATTDITKANKTIVGNWEPKIQGGIISNLAWRGIDFNFTFTYSLGGKCFDDLAASYSNGSYWAQYGIAIPSYYDIDKTWKKPGDQAELPIYIYGGTGNEYSSSRFIMSTNYLRLKNMTLGYSFPKRWVSKAGFEKLRIYASGNNLFTVKHKDTYVDPETIIGGVSSMTTPNLRTISFGIELGF